jgi:hypothetical protein
VGLAIYDEHDPIVVVATFNNATGTNLTSCFAKQDTTVRIDAYLVSCDDTVDHTINLELYHDNFHGPIGVCKIPLTCGYGIIPAADIVALLAPAAIGAILLPAMTEIRAKLAVALTAGKYMYFTALGGRI